MSHKLPGEIPARIMKAVYGCGSEHDSKTHPLQRPILLLAQHTEAWMQEIKGDIAEFRAGDPGDLAIQSGKIAGIVTEAILTGLINMSGRWGAVDTVIPAIKSLSHHADNTVFLAVLKAGIGKPGIKPPTP